MKSINFAAKWLKYQVSYCLASFAFYLSLACYKLGGNFAAESSPEYKKIPFLAPITSKQERVVVEHVRENLETANFSCKYVGNNVFSNLLNIKGHANNNFRTNRGDGRTKVDVLLEERARSGIVITPTAYNHLVFVGIVGAVSKLDMSLVKAIYSAEVIDSTALILNCTFVLGMSWGLLAAAKLVSATEDVLLLSHSDRLLYKNAIENLSTLQNRK